MKSKKARALIAGLANEANDARAEVRVQQARNDAIRTDRDNLASQVRRLNSECDDLKAKTDSLQVELDKLRAFSPEEQERIRDWNEARRMLAKGGLSGTFSGSPTNVTDILRVVDYLKVGRK